MSISSPSLGPILPVILAFGVATLLASTRFDTTSATSDGPALDHATLASALASDPLPEGVSRDALVFHRERHLARPEEPLPARSLAATHLLRFRAYGDRAELEAAEPLIRTLVDRYDDAGAHGLRAGAALAQHDFDGAQEAADAAAARSPAGDVSAALRRVDVLFARGRYADAQRLFQGLETPFQTQAYLSRKARLLDAVGETEEAARVMDDVVRLTDAYADAPAVRAWARVESGHFRHHSGNTPGGVARYREALEFVPGYPAALEALAWIAYGVDQDPVVAEALFEKALEHGGHLDLYLVLREIASSQGAEHRAESYRAAFLEKARASGQGAMGWNPMYWRPLGLTLAEKPATLDEALRLAEADLAQREDRGAWATLAWVLHRAGEGEAALEAAERALTWGAPPPAVLHLAGVVIHTYGETARGRRILREALEGEAELGPVTARAIRLRLGKSDPWTQG